MNFKDVIGLDISKLTIDVVIHSSKEHFIVKNKLRGFKSILNKVYKLSSFDQNEIVFLLEHTGLYAHLICDFFTKNNTPFVLVSGMEIKRSLGISRGKDDKLDAAKIALYGYRRREELELYQMPNNNILKIKRLLGLRDKLVKQRAGYKACTNEQKRVYKRKDNELLFKCQEKMIHVMSLQIKQVDDEMKRIIYKDEQFLQMFLLLLSIKGVGKQTALYLIVYTNGFTKFKNYRKFASYCGIAPFPNRSGSSIRGKTKISNLAFKKIKTLLDLCAKSAIQYNTEMRQYYHKRITEGKNKRSTINIIRNKLLSRMFAVINRKTPYVDVFKFAA